MPIRKGKKPFSVQYYYINVHCRIKRISLLSGYNHFSAERYIRKVFIKTAHGRRHNNTSRLQIISIPRLILRS